MKHTEVDDLATRLAMAVQSGDDFEELQSKFYEIIWNNTREYEKKVTAEQFYKECGYNYTEFSRMTHNNRSTARTAVKAGDLARVIEFNGQPVLLVAASRGKGYGNSKKS
ncbi:hypothetical protein vBVpP1_43 [Vibrio phage vB_VpP_1]|nr:hypothetical protein vBVpP1_43 [Vibrio phage vB_VpP_1]